MKKYRILVTGGAGFIGSHVANTYAEAGHQVIVIDNLSTGKKINIGKKVKLYICDITKQQAIKAILKKENPEIISHHAAQTKIDTSIKHPLNDVQTNILGLLNILFSLSTQRHRVKKIIFASSGGAIYDDDFSPPFLENSHVKPRSPYGITKLASEQYLDFFYRTHQIPYIVLRYSNVYGPKQSTRNETGAVDIFCKKCIQQKSPIIYGKGTQTRDFIFIDDVVKANLLALQPNALGIFNIGTGEATSINELFTMLQNLANTSLLPKYLPKKQYEIQQSCLDITKAKRELDFQANVSLKKGLLITLRQYQQAYLGSLKANKL